MQTGQQPDYKQARCSDHNWQPKQKLLSRYLFRNVFGHPVWTDTDAHLTRLLLAGRLRQSLPMVPVVWVRAGVSERYPKCREQTGHRDTGQEASLPRWFHWVFLSNQFRLKARKSTGVR